VPRARDGKYNHLHDIAIGKTIKIPHPIVGWGIQAKMNILV
jgi:hypothetical protein